MHLVAVYISAIIIFYSPVLANPPYPSEFCVCVCVYVLLP